MKKFKAAVTDAQDVLKDREKILSALHGEESRLEGLVRARVHAESELMQAEGAEAVGEKSDVGAAQGRVDSVKGKIASQVRKLAAVRTRLAAQAGALQAAHTALSAGLPEHQERIKEAFREEWSDGAAAFARLLSKRKAIESLVGGAFSLAEPTPVTTTVQDLGLPWELLGKLAGAVEELSGWAAAEVYPALDSMARMPHPQFIPDAVYIATSDLAGVPAGTHLVQGSVAPGILERLVFIGYAAPPSSLGWADAMAATSAARLQIAAEQSQARDAAEPKLPGYSQEVLDRSERANQENIRRAIHTKGDGVSKPVGTPPGAPPPEFDRDGKPGRADNAGFGQNW
jgi:hypothetical protein